MNSNSHLFGKSKYKFRDYLEAERWELSENDIEGIKTLLEEGNFTITEIAESYGVERTVIHAIKRQLRSSKDWEFSA